MSTLIGYYGTIFRLIFITRYTRRGVFIFASLAETPRLVLHYIRIYRYHFFFKFSRLRLLNKTALGLYLFTVRDRNVISLIFIDFTTQLYEIYIPNLAVISSCRSERLQI